MMNRWLVVSFLALSAAGSAFAGLITHNGAPDNSVTTPVIGITGFQTFGDNMNGMEVSVIFAGGDTASCIWAATGVGAGGCSGVGVNSALNTFGLSLTGDTFSALWNLTATGREVASLIINAYAGNTVFDIIPTDPFGSTPGSAEGVAVNGTTVGNFNGAGGYSNRIQIGANNPVGDLYGTLRIDFAGPVASASFVADTDTIGEPVPEPTSLALLAGGLALLAWKRRR